MTTFITTSAEVLTPEIIAKREIKVAEFKGQVAALRYKILGLARGDQEWYKAHTALEFCLSHHTGWRKDGITPAAMHQIQIANHAMTFLSDLLFPVRTIIAALLHDTPEDTPVSHAEVRDLFGSASEEDVEILTKEYRGAKKNIKIYHADQAKNPVTSIIKPIDRNNNMSTMVGVFKFEKQISYCAEVREDYFEMLKTARRAYPQQETVYESLKLSLTIQLRIYDAIHAQGKAA
jgi:(p)ppGpp synthase/HD superfamily hydrolase